MELKFEAKLSFAGIILTLCSNLLVFGVSYIGLFRPDLLEGIVQLPEIIKYLIILILVVAFVSAYLLHPVKYIINGSFIAIKKPFHVIKIPFSSIVKIKKTTYNGLRIRSGLFASVGIWGYFGQFHSTRYGKVKMNVSNLKTLVFIATKNGKIIIISPENSSTFVEKVDDKLVRF